MTRAIVFLTLGMWAAFLLACANKLPETVSRLKITDTEMTTAHVASQELVRTEQPRKSVLKIASASATTNGLEIVFVIDTSPARVEQEAANLRASLLYVAEDLIEVDGAGTTSFVRLAQSQAITNGPTFVDPGDWWSVMHEDAKRVVIAQKYLFELVGPSTRLDTIRLNTRRRDVNQTHWSRFVGRFNLDHSEVKVKDNEHVNHSLAALTCLRSVYQSE